LLHQTQQNTFAFIRFETGNTRDKPIQNRWPVHHVLNFAFCRHLPLLVQPASLSSCQRTSYCPIVWHGNGLKEESSIWSMSAKAISWLMKRQPVSEQLNSLCCASAWKAMLIRTMEQ
jgi:hypothetical protein